MERAGILLRIFLLLCTAPLVGAGNNEYRIVHADAVSHGSSRQELSGNVVVEFGDIRLSAGRMVYDPATKELNAWENVKIVDPSFSLFCGRLTYFLSKGEAVAWGKPKLVFSEVRSQNSIAKTILTGVQIWIFSKEQRVQVFEDVVISRYEPAAQSETGKIEFRVCCNTMEALRRVKRTTFKGNVVLETPSVGAKSQRAVYDQLNSRFYLLGDSRAWNYSLSGDPVNTVEGEKIVYFLRQKKTVVIGNVVADVKPEVKTGERIIPARVNRLSTGN